MQTRLSKELNNKDQKLLDWNNDPNKDEIIVPKAVAADPHVPIASVTLEKQGRYLKIGRILRRQLIKEDGRRTLENQKKHASFETRWQYRHNDDM